MKISVTEDLMNEQKRVCSSKRLKAGFSFGMQAAGQKHRLPDVKRHACS